MIYLVTRNEVIGSASRYVYDRVGPHQVAAIARLKLEHTATLRLAEGASILSLFAGAVLVVGTGSSPASVLSGTSLLHSTSRPELKDVIVFVPKEGAEHPPLGDLLSKGVALLNRTR
jgi:hypothetical protein